VTFKDEVTSVDLRSDGGARATAGGRIRAPLPPPTNPSSSPPGCWLPRFLLLVSGNPRTVLAVVGPERDQPSGEVSREERLPAGGRGDDHASQARGAAAGPPDPVGPVLLRRARRLLAQPPHRLQEGSQGCSHICGLVLFSHGVLLCSHLLEMVQTFSHVCNFRNSSSSESQNL